MAFYIAPPGGNVSLQKLAQFAETRFNFLVQVYETNGDRMKLLDLVTSVDNVVNSECLIDGTLHDRLSHFILRLACCDHGDMYKFLVDTETILFNFRFSCMKKDELIKLFRSLNSFLQYKSLLKFQPSLDSVESILVVFKQIKDSCHSWTSLVSRYLCGDDAGCFHGDNTCFRGDEAGCFQVPFHTVPRLIARRRVGLQRGVARVPFSLLRHVVTGLFSAMLSLGVRDARLNCTTHDERIVQIFRKMKLLYRRSVGRSTVQGGQLSLSCCDVDRVVSLFPPCMSHLHRVLRDHHRLKHNDRIRYTLFLKEAGLPVHDALMFWRKEYCQLPSNSAGGCCHDWAQQEGRYTYNIRHLYGLEGSRINYRGHSCATLQTSPLSGSECGGCPFTQYNTPQFWTTMREDGVHVNAEQLSQLSECGDYTGACTAYMMAKLKISTSTCTNCHGDERLANSEETSSPISVDDDGHHPRGSVTCCGARSCGAFNRDPVITEHSSQSTDSRIADSCGTVTNTSRVLNRDSIETCNCANDGVLSVRSNDRVSENCETVTNTSLVLNCDAIETSNSSNNGVLCVKTCIPHCKVSESCEPVTDTRVVLNCDSKEVCSTLDDSSIRDNKLNNFSHGRKLTEHYIGSITDEYCREASSVGVKEKRRCSCDIQKSKWRINKPIDFYVMSKIFHSKSDREMGCRMIEES